MAGLDALGDLTNLTDLTAGVGRGARGRRLGCFVMDVATFLAMPPPAAALPASAAVFAGAFTRRRPGFGSDDRTAVLADPIDPEVGRDQSVVAFQAHRHLEFFLDAGERRALVVEDIKRHR
ncbi:MAG: hypothetical protein HYW28_13195, partial [Rhodospirillales bacterium]|nr:hypothetical protein [Rhodospirillales bacterium]